MSNAGERLYKIILAPYVSEKASRIGENGQYVFRVDTSANKYEIKKAVEMLFKVEVTAVRICNVKGKIKSFRNKKGERKGWKKAYIALKEGQIIDLTGKS